MGPKIRRYISSVWENQRFLLRQQGVYSVPLDVERGCTQGDTDSPIIFNIIVDAVLRAWKIGTFKNTKALFYADDRLLEHTNAEDLQEDLNKIIGLFERVGLRTNETKTKYMIFRGPAPPKAICPIAYKRMTKGVGKTYLERRKTRVNCAICGKGMQNGSLQRHMW